MPQPGEAPWTRAASCDLSCLLALTRLTVLSLGCVETRAAWVHSSAVGVLAQLTGLRKLTFRNLGKGFGDLELLRLTALQQLAVLHIQANQKAHDGSGSTLLGLSRLRLRKFEGERSVAQQLLEVCRCNSAACRLQLEMEEDARLAASEAEATGLRERLAERDAQLAEARAEIARLGERLRPR